ncbi:MAG TPA: hypothetical protein VNK91_00620 [Burkholderiaceae bacterium]|nr:hypothetical protein [Burkholderiaceae bacterium]
MGGLAPAAAAAAPANRRRNVRRSIIVFGERFGKGRGPCDGRATPPILSTRVAAQVYSTRPSPGARAGS